MECETGAFAGLLGRSPAMERLRREIAQLGPRELRVHVFGETGTGKEMVARALHALSRRARRRLVPVNVAGVSDELLAARALRPRPRGLHGGGDGPRRLRRRGRGGHPLHRRGRGHVGHGRRSGSCASWRGGSTGGWARRLRRANVRVISATHVDLARRVREGRFRAGPLVPPQRRADPRPSATGARSGRAPARRGTSSVSRRPARGRPPVLSPRGGGGPPGLRVAGQRAGAQERDAAARGAGGGPGGQHSRTSRGSSRRAGQRVGDAARGPQGARGRARAGALDRNGGIVARAAAELGITRQSLWAKVRRRGLVGESA